MRVSLETGRRSMKGIWGDLSPDGNATAATAACTLLSEVMTRCRRLAARTCGTVGALGVLANSARGQAPDSVLEYAHPEIVRSIATRERRLDIGGSGGVEFLRVLTILPRVDGSFVVVNAGTNELRFFSATGRLSATVGRRGGGPGEYQDIRSAALLPGDSIAVFDPIVRRISILGPSGEFVRSFSIAPPFEGGGSPTSMVALRNGVLLVGYSEVRTMAPQPFAVSVRQRMFSYSTTGTLRSHIGFSVPNSEHFVQTVPARMGGVAYWNLAFGRSMTLRADSTFLLLGDGKEWMVERRTEVGSVVRSYRVRRSASPVTAAVVEAYKKNAVAGSQGEQRATAERMVAEMPYPRLKPTYQRFETDGDGRVWIESYGAQGDDQPIWLRLDTRERRAAAAFRWPSRFRPLAFKGTLVYGVWRDDDDVEHVQVFAVEGA